MVRTAARLRAIAKGIAQVAQLAHRDIASDSAAGREAKGSVGFGHGGSVVDSVTDEKRAAAKFLNPGGFLPR